MTVTREKKMQDDLETTSTAKAMPKEWGGTIWRTQESTWGAIPLAKPGTIWASK